MSGLPAGARLRVLRGSATAHEVIAILLALDLARAAEEPPPPAPAWRTAARLEATGGTRVSAAADLETARRRPLG